MESEARCGGAENRWRSLAGIEVISQSPGSWFGRHHRGIIASGACRRAGMRQRSSGEPDMAQSRLARSMDN